MKWSEFDLIDHALRSPLNAALVNLELVSSSSPSAEREVARIRSELRRLADTLLPATLTLLSLELVEVAAADLRVIVERTFEVHGLSGIRLAPQPWPDVEVDARLLGLALVHLARNALAATPAGRPAPEITPTVRDDGGVDVLVRDWGVGLDGARSTQAYPGRRGHLGGVAAVVRIARMHGGSVAFAPKDPGTLVRLSLPARCDKAPGRRPIVRLRSHRAAPERGT